MLQIHHDEPDAQTPSKAYADACWRDNPRLSPDWWREALGHTVGKLALDWRTSISQPEHLTIGCNLVLASPATWSATCRTLSAQASPSVFVTILVTSNPAAQASPSPHFMAWSPESTPPEDYLATLITLETMAKSGQIEAYGLSFTTLPQPNLTTWLQLATQAAEAVYGRKKRPALRLLHAALDLTNLTLLSTPHEVHKSENISTLELCARLGFAVVISPLAVPENPLLPLQALPLLTQAAEYENELNQHLKGWPQLHGQPLFSILAHLAQGQTPWPTPNHWHNWKNHLLPQLQTHWQTLSNPLVKAYLDSLTELLPYGEALSQTAVQPVLHQMLETISPRLAAPWQALEPLEQTLAVLTSIPGISAVAPACAYPVKSLQNMSDIPDIGALLLA